jgi:filamentous hemagglutinin
MSLGLGWWLRSTFFHDQADYGGSSYYVGGWVGFAGDLLMGVGAFKSLGKTFGREALECGLRNAPVRTAAGGIGDIPGAIPRNSGLPIFKQSGPTCVANSCGMVLDQVAAGRSLTNLGKYRGVLTADGVGLDQAASILNANGIGAVYREGITVRGLREMVGLNKPAIVRIMTPDGGHAVIVDSFTKRMGKQVVSIRNPHGVEYYQPLNEFMKVFNGHVVKLQ